MRKMRFLIFSFLTALFILLLSISGCGSSTPTSSGNQTAIAGLSGSTNMSAQSTSKKEEKKKEKKKKESTEDDETDDNDNTEGGTGTGNTNTGGTGNASGPVIAVVPTAPVGVVATANIGQNTINWVAATGVTSYNIYWSTTPGVNQTTGTKIAGLTTTSYTQTGLTAGTTYYYIITAVNANGESISSAQVSGVPLAPLPVIVARNVAYVVNSADNNISVIDLQTYATIKTIPVGINPYFVAVNPNTNKVYVTNLGDNTVSIIDTKTDTVIGTITGVTTPMDIKVNPQTNRLYVTSNYNPYLTVIDANTNTVIASVLCGQWTRGVTLDTQANKAYVANTVTNDVSVVDMNTNTVIATISMGINPQPHAIGIDIAAKRIYTADHARATVSVIDTTTNAVIATIPTGTYPQGIFVNSISHRAYVGSSWTAGLGVISNDTITVIDTLTNQVVATIPVGVAPGVFEFGYNSVNNLMYVTNTGSDNVSVIDSKTNQVIATFPVGKTPLGIVLIP